MRDNIIFIPTPIKSHILPSFYLASLLKNEFDVHYLVADKYLANIVKDNNYNAIISDKYKSSFEMEVPPTYKSRKKKYFEYLVSIINQEADKLRKAELKEICDILNPKAIFIDIFSPTDYILLNGLKKKNLFFFNPMPSTYRIKEFPVVSEPDFLNRHYEINRNVLKSAKISLNGLLNQPKKTFLALLNFFFTKKMLRDNKVIKKAVTKNNEYTIGFVDVPEFLLIPIEFEFSKEVQLPWQIYCGLCVNESRIHNDVDADYNEDWLKISRIDKPIIYCSFGTYYSGAEEKLLYFIEKLMLIKREIDALFIISTNNINIKNEIKLKAVDDFYVYISVPQLQVLKKASIYICHGGMGSVKESIFNGVPLLVYPLDLNYDQCGNGLKVTYHGIGLNGDLMIDDEKRILEKIKDLLTNDKYSQKIRDLKKQIDMNYSDEKNYKLIKSLLL